MLGGRATRGMKGPGRAHGSWHLALGLLLLTHLLTSRGQELVDSFPRAGAASVSSAVVSVPPRVAGAGPGVTLAQDRSSLPPSVPGCGAGGGEFLQRAGASRSRMSGRHPGWPGSPRAAPRCRRGAEGATRGNWGVPSSLG